MIRNRAADMATLGGEEEPVPPSMEKPEPPVLREAPKRPENIAEVEGGQSAATRLKAATVRLDEDRAAYDTARTEYESAKDEYDASKRSDSSATEEVQAKKKNMEAKQSAMETAKKKVQATASDVAKHSRAVKSSAKKAKSRIISSSKSNVQKNQGNIAYEEAHKQARVNIQRMRDAGASEKQIQNAEEQLALAERQATASGFARYDDAKREDSEVSGTDIIVKLNRGLNKKISKLERKKQPASSKPERMSSSAARRKIPGDGRTSSRKVVVDLSVIDSTTADSVKDGVNDGRLTSMLESYSRFQSAEGSDKNASRSFIEDISKLDATITLDNKQFEAALSTISKERTPENMSVDQYRDDLRARYERAADKYNRNMEDAISKAKAYSSSPDPATLEAVKASIASLCESNKEIADLKKEIQVEEKK